VTANCFFAVDGRCASNFAEVDIETGNLKANEGTQNTKKTKCTSAVQELSLSRSHTVTLTVTSRKIAFKKIKSSNPIVLKKIPTLHTIIFY